VLHKEVFRINSFFDKVRSSAESAAYKISVRTNTAWRKAMLNKRIIERRADMTNAYKILARRYYEMWKSEKVDFDEIDAICQSILDKEDEVNGMELEIRELARKERADIDRWEELRKAEKPVAYNVVKREPEPIIEPEAETGGSEEVVSAEGSSEHKETE
jgi:vacuolar-type H+-ATPase subunit I/STV1